MSEGREVHEDELGQTEREGGGVALGGHTTHAHMLQGVPGKTGEGPSPAGEGQTAVTGPCTRAEESTEQRRERSKF